MSSIVFLPRKGNEQRMAARPALLYRCPRIYIGMSGACRQFIEGVLWIARFGSQCPKLPERYSRWNSVYKRFAHWEKAVIWNVCCWIAR